MNCMSCWRAVAVMVLMSVCPDHAHADASVEPPIVDDICTANEAAWSGIHSLDVVFNMRVDERRGGQRPDVHRDVVTGGRWTRRGNVERLRRPDSRHEFLEDTLLDGAVANVLRVPMAANVATVTLSNQQGVRGHRKKQVPRMLWKHRDRPCLLDYLSDFDDSPLTLRELLSQLNVVEISAVEEGAAGSDRRWLIRAEHPSDAPAGKHAGSYVDVLVNQSKSFLVERVDSYITGVGKDARTGQPVAIRTVLEVKKFRDCGDGVFIPAAVVFANHGNAADNNAEQSLGHFVTIELTEVSINEDLPADALAFAFPEHLIVRSELGVDRANSEVLSIWGADNRPVRQFTDHATLERYVDSESPLSLGSVVRGTRRNPIPVWAAVTAMILLAVGACLGRLRRRQPSPT